MFTLSGPEKSSVKTNKPPTTYTANETFKTYVKLKNWPVDGSSWSPLVIKWYKFNSLIAVNLQWCNNEVIQRRKEGLQMPHKYTKKKINTWIYFDCKWWHLEIPNLMCNSILHPHLFCTEKKFGFWIQFVSQRPVLLWAPPSTKQFWKN